VRRADVLCSWLAFAPLALSGCSGVLGLDPPSLDPCVQDPTTCLDGSVLIPDANLADTSSQNDAPDVVIADAGRDTSKTDSAVDGIRCGGDPYPVVGCTGTKLCCQEIDDAGNPNYVCTGTSSCDGYPIACASNADCGGSDVCCHFSSGTKCENASVCSNGSLVCEPTGPSDQCPPGWKCTGSVVDDGTPAPYFVCAQ
jgi:hypothetical protein